MAISAYTGLPGSGKSYGVVANVILPAVKAGREVWTNVALRMDEWDKAYPDHRIKLFDISDVIADREWFQNTLPPGVVLVIDELWKLWKKGMRQLDAPEGHQSFLAEHRHIVGEDGLSTEVVFVTQDLAQLAAFSIQLVEQTSISLKMRAVGSDKRFRLDMYMGAIKGQSGPKDKLIGSTHGKYEKAVYALYNTHTKSATGVAGAEVKVDKRGTVWGRPAIKYGVPLAFIAVIAGVWNVMSFFNPEPESAVHSSSETAGTGQVAAAPAKMAKIPNKAPIWSERWRLGGIIASSNGVVRALLVGKDSRARMMRTTDCHKFDDSGEWYCDVEGSRVTSWTGPKPSAIQSLTASIGPAVPAS